MAARERITPKEFEEALTTDVKMVPFNEQQAFFAADGPLRKSIELIDRQVEKTETASDPARLEQMITTIAIDLVK